MNLNINEMMGQTVKSYYGRSNTKKSAVSADKEKGFDSPEYAYDKTEEKQAKGTLYNRNSFRVSKNTEQVKLSDKAKELLDELKKKYSNMDFFVENAADESEEEAIMSRGTKQYSVLIDPETLEKMAEDEDYKNQNLQLLEESAEKLSNVMEELGDKADKVESLSVKVNGDGTVDYFAKLKADSKEESERIAKKREADRIEKKKADKEKADKKAEEKAEEKADKKAEDRKKEEKLHGEKNEAFDPMKAFEASQNRGNRFAGNFQSDEKNIIRASSADELISLLNERLS